MAVERKNRLGIQLEIWARQKARPYPIGILEIVAAKLDYVGTAIRQRHQSMAQVPVATDRAIDYVGSNVARAEDAFKRLVREIKVLGGDATSREETWYFKDVRYQVLKADLTFEGVRNQAVYKRSREIFREAKELEEQLKAKVGAKIKRTKKSRPEKKEKPKEEKVSPVSTTLQAPRLVRRR